MPFVIGETVGPYHLAEQLGQGGMATVFKAYHAALDRYVAIKVLHIAFMDDPNFLGRFQREARVVARLDHPNIVPVYDFAEHEGRPYLVMKFIEGITLKTQMEQGRLPAAEILRIVETIGGSLDYAHRSGVLHRDIKPSNVLIANDGQLYLADFGLARMAAAGESSLTTDRMVGTPQYMSPEQALSRADLDERSDIYSFGVMLYEMLVGRVPYNADTPFAIIHDHIYSPLPLPRTVNPDVPEVLERVLLKALAKDPADRYKTIGALVEAYRSTSQGGGSLSAASFAGTSYPANSVPQVRITPPVGVAPPVPSASATMVAAVTPASPQGNPDLSHPTGTLSTSDSVEPARSAGTTHPAGAALAGPPAETPKATVDTALKQGKSKGWWIALIAGVLVVGLVCMLAGAWIGSAKSRGQQATQNARTTRVSGLGLALKTSQPLMEETYNALLASPTPQSTLVGVAGTPAPAQTADVNSPMIQALDRAIAAYQNGDPAQVKQSLLDMRAALGSDSTALRAILDHVAKKEAWMVGAYILLDSPKRIASDVALLAIPRAHQIVYNAAADPLAHDLFASNSGDPLLKVAAVRNNMMFGKADQARQTLDRMLAQNAQQRYPEARLLDVELDAQTNQMDTARSKLASLMQDSAVLPAWINDATKAWKDKINP